MCLTGGNKWKNLINSVSDDARTGFTYTGPKLWPCDGLSDFSNSVRSLAEAFLWNGKVSQTGVLGLL